METPETWLRKNLTEGFSLPESAVDWLCSIYDVFQIFDDYADNDDVSRERLNRLIWDTLIGLPSNPFYLQHSFHLLPVLSTQILKWQASDTAERGGEASEKAYMWRAGYYDLVLIIVFLVHGRELAEKHAHEVMALYGETYAEYKAEFGGELCQVVQ